MCYVKWLGIPFMYNIKYVLYIYFLILLHVTIWHALISLVYIISSVRPLNARRSLQKQAEILNRNLKESNSAFNTHTHTHTMFDTECRNYALLGQGIKLIFGNKGLTVYTCGLQNNCCNNLKFFLLVYLHSPPIFIYCISSQIQKKCKITMRVLISNAYKVFRDELRIKCSLECVEWVDGLWRWG